MRYTVGQQYPFTVTKFKSKSGREVLNGIGGLYYPWDDQLIAVEVRMLTCIEHHKVPSEWDEAESPDLCYDGFIFGEGDVVDGELKIKNVWHNQYPRASYGQLSDSADRYVHLNPDPSLSEEEIKQLYDKSVVQMEDATARLGLIYRGVYQMNEDVKECLATPNKFTKTPAEMTVMAAQLGEFAAQLKAAIEEAAGRKLVVGPLKYKSKKEGVIEEHTLPGHFRVAFVDEPEDDELIIG